MTREAPVEHSRTGALLGLFLTLAGLVGWWPLPMLLSWAPSDPWLAWTGFAAGTGATILFAAARFWPRRLGRGVERWARLLGLAGFVAMLFGMGLSDSGSWMAWCTGKPLSTAPFASLGGLLVTIPLVYAGLGQLGYAFTAPSERSTAMRTLPLLGLAAGAGVMLWPHRSDYPLALLGHVVHLQAPTPMVLLTIGYLLGSTQAFWPRPELRRPAPLPHVEHTGTHLRLTTPALGRRGLRRVATRLAFGLLAMCASLPVVLVFPDSPFLQLLPVVLLAAVATLLLDASLYVATRIRRRSTVLITPTSAVVTRHTLLGRTRHSVDAVDLALLVESRPDGARLHVAPGLVVAFDADAQWLHDTLAPIRARLVHESPTDAQNAHDALGLPEPPAPAVHREPSDPFHRNHTVLAFILYSTLTAWILVAGLFGTDPSALVLGLPVYLALLATLRSLRALLLPHVLARPEVSRAKPLKAEARPAQASRVPNISRQSCS
jgi:hypothetical protein